MNHLPEKPLTGSLPGAILRLEFKNIFKYLSEKTAMREHSIFKVLSDSQRRDILRMLKKGRMNAGEIAEQLGVSAAALSYHLKLLKAADLVLEYRQKIFIYYEINTTVFDELVLWIGQFGRGDENISPAGAESPEGGVR